MQMRNTQQTEQALGLQIAECQDLAVALQGKHGTFVASTPEGTTLVIEAQAGHSIASLCIIPKPLTGLPTFNYAQVSDWEYSQQQRQQQQQR